MRRSLLSLSRRHWDHEPTPNPSQEGNGQDADRCLFPSWEGSGVGRFMESLLSLLRRHSDHEPWKAPASRTHSKRFAESQALGHCAAAFGVRGACSRFRTRFMESLLIVMTLMTLPLAGLAEKKPGEAASLD